MFYPFISQLSKPEGFWVHANQFGFCSRFGGAYRADAAVVCGPSDLNGVAPVVVTPAVPGLGVRIPVDDSALLDWCNHAIKCFSSIVDGDSTAVVVVIPGVRIPAHRSALMSGNRFFDSACATVLAHDDTSPDSLIPSRMAAFSTMYASQQVTISEIKPTAIESKNARPIASLNAMSMSSPVVARPIIHVRKSNFDLTGFKLVKRGLTVSYQACRGRVARVRSGHCCIEYLHFSGRLTGSSEWLDCNSVQVVG